MKPRKGNPDQYLQQIGGTWYARVRVPRTLEKTVGQSHLRQSLGTGSKAQANRLKHEVVAILKARIQGHRDSPGKPEGARLTLQYAREFRQHLQELRASNRPEDEEQASTLEDVAVTLAEEVEAVHGTERAVKFYRAATSEEDSLQDLMGKWLDDSDDKESTKAGHRKALGDLLKFLDNPEARPADITKGTPGRYVDHMKANSGLSAVTLGEKLRSLASLWEWMQAREYVPADRRNPWEGHKFSKTKNPGTRPPKRKGGYLPDELVKLLTGTQQARGWPTWSYLPDLMVLGMFTGSRLEKLCDLTAGQVEPCPAGFILHIGAAKKEAAGRLVGVVHPAPVAALRRRLEGRQPGDILFPELSPGGLDDRMGASATKAYGRYRRACGVPDGTDFHSYRRNVIDVLEKARVPSVEIARFVGHKVGVMHSDTYAGQSLGPETTLEVAGRVRYPEEVEAAALAVVGGDRPAPKELPRKPRRKGRSTPSE
ncbi:MAG TPA: hypothetical protein PK306_05505 [Aquabacterium sp.]|nr:hypothetical protein [Aquabacterium sp.]